MKHLFIILLVFTTTLAFAQELDLNSYMFNPLSKYLSEDEYKEMISTVTSHKKVMKGDVLTIDTRDRKSCEAIIRDLNMDENLCEEDPESPYISVVKMQEMDRNELEIKLNMNLSKNQKEILKEVRNFGIIGSAMMGIVYMLPEELTQWDRNTLRAQYRKNVEQGPVIDKDPWVVNYIGHPLSGAAFYVFVRHRGASALESLAFTAFMSTFYWEYGFEALVEPPSIQDLIITPLIGAVIGEVFHRTMLKIDQNGGTLYGSHRLGTIAKVLMNPAEMASKHINQLLDRKIIKKSDYSLVLGNTIQTDNDSLQIYDNSYVGLRMKFEF